MSAENEPSDAPLINETVGLIASSEEEMRGHRSTYYLTEILKNMTAAIDARDRRKQAEYSAAMHEIGCLAYWAKHAAYEKTKNSNVK